MPFERLSEYLLKDIGLDEGALDGPFLMGSVKFGLLLSLRGKGGGKMPGPGEIQWTIFYIENQGVCVWATEATGDDPPVYVQQSERAAPWKREADSLSGFLIQLMILEAVLGAPFSASHDGVARAELARLAKRVRPLSLGAWTSSKTRFFGSSGVIGFALENGDGFDVWLGANDRARMEPIEDAVSEWDNIGF